MFEPGMDAGEANGRIGYTGLYLQSFSAIGDGIRSAVKAFKEEGIEEPSAEAVAEAAKVAMMEWQASIMLRVSHEVMEKLEVLVDCAITRLEDRENE